jgi:hypothetical protein
MKNYFLIIGISSDAICLFVWLTIIVSFFLYTLYYYKTKHGKTTLNNKHQKHFGSE